MTAAVLAVGAVHLDDLDAVAGQGGGQPGPVGAGAFDSGALEVAQGVGPVDQLLVAAAGGRDRQRGEVSAELIDRDTDMGVGVGVDTDDHLDGWI